VLRSLAPLRVDANSACQTDTLSGSAANLVHTDGATRTGDA
jgi:hypothetical protein